MRIEIDIHDKAVSELFARVATRITDMKPAMEQIGEIIRASVVKNFRAGGRPTKWRRSNRAKQQGGQTLLDTGRLRNSFTVEPSAHDVSVGTNVKYAAVHHFGAKKHSFGTFATKVKAHDRIVKKAFGRILDPPVTAKVKEHDRNVKLPWGDIPARPFMMVQDQDWKEIMRAMSAYLAQTPSEAQI